MTSVSSACMSRLLLWRNVSGSEENWVGKSRPQLGFFSGIRLIGRVVVVGVCSPLVCVIAIVETAVRSIFQIFVISILSSTHPTRTLLKAKLLSSFDTIAWSLITPLGDNISHFNLPTVESVKANLIPLEMGESYDGIKKVNEALKKNVSDETLLMYFHRNPDRLSINSQLDLLNNAVEKKRNSKVLDAILRGLDLVEVAQQLIVRSFSLETFKYLLGKGVNPNVKSDGLWGSYLLESKIVSNAPEAVIKLLLEYGANPTLRCCNYFEGLVGYSLKNSYSKEIIELLIDRGDHYLKGVNGFTILDFVGKLHKKGVDLNKVVFKVFDHISWYDTDVIRYFFEHGVDVNCVDEKGNSLLMRAIQSGKEISFIQCLINTWGADASQGNLSNATPLSEAKRLGKKDVVSLLASKTSGNWQIFHFIKNKLGLNFTPNESTPTYMILGLSPSSTDRERLRAFKKISLKLHPDKNLEKKEVADAAFGWLNGLLQPNDIAV